MIEVCHPDEDETLWRVLEVCLYDQDVNSKCHTCLVGFRLGDSPEGSSRCVPRPGCPGTCHAQHEYD
eukprot:458279-Amorphochlora_amoeboformis.AAC.2